MLRRLNVIPEDFMNRFCRRFALLLFPIPLLAGCGDFVAPELAGQWGGENLEVRFKAGVTQIALPCGGIGTLEGDIHLSGAGAFSKEGRISFTGWPVTYSYEGRISGTIAGSTMSVLIENLELDVDYHPPAIMVRRGQSGTFTVLCAAAAAPR